MTWKDKKLKLAPREVKSFFHNAQIAACDLVDADEQRIDFLACYTEQLVKVLKEGTLTKNELLVVLTSAVWEIYTGGKHDKIPSVR